MKATELFVEFHGRRLEVFTNDEGTEYTPLKPIVELFGLSWKMQRKKFQERPGFARNLGICSHMVMAAGGQKRDQICIEVDGVAPFLITLNSDLIRAKGNIASADFLDARFLEWKRVIADYHRRRISQLPDEDKKLDALARRYLVLSRLIAQRERSRDARLLLLSDDAMVTFAQMLGHKIDPLPRPARAQPQMDLFVDDPEDDEDGVATAVAFGGYKLSDQPDPVRSAGESDQP